MREAKTPYIPDYFHHVLTLTMQCRWYIKVTWPCFCGIRGYKAPQGCPQSHGNHVMGNIFWSWKNYIMLLGHGNHGSFCQILPWQNLLSQVQSMVSTSDPTLLIKAYFFKISIFSWWQTPLSTKCYMYLPCTIRKILVKWPCDKLSYDKLQVMTAVK